MRPSLMTMCLMACTAAKGTAAVDTFDPLAGAGPLPLCINEFMASNKTALTDDDSTPDWIELHNPSTEEVSLAGWTITDDLTEPHKHALDGTLSVPPGGWLVLLADGDEDEGPRHLSFKLSAAGEDIGLFDGAGGGEGISFPTQSADQSRARSPDCCEGEGCWQTVAFGTPGATNEQ